MNNKLLFPTQSLFSNNCIQTKYVKKMTSFKVVKTDISIFYLMVKRTVYLIKIIEHLLTVTPLPLMNKKSAQCVCVCVCVCVMERKRMKKKENEK